jgi:multimeric flavodoxin WrbA
MILTAGLSGFFKPNPLALLGHHVPLPVDAAGYYSTLPLEATLSDLVDFSSILGGPARLTVGAANIQTGEMRYFDSCPWHNWKFHRCSGAGEPGLEGDRVPAYPVKVESGHVLVNLAGGSKRVKSPHEPHPLARKVERAAGPLRLTGIATTAMDTANPRFSGSGHLLDQALKAARELGAETRMIKLNDLNFRACEGYYSKAARACTWPCSITQMDAKDEMDQVYEALVHWADVVIVSSPIRWGAASSLYFKMADRLNCVQNAVTIRNQVLIRNKVAGFIIVGGQDNIQAVAGQMLGFFAELGFIFPQFPYVAHSRGWSHEDMERNVEIVRASKELAEGAAMLTKRCLDLAGQLIARDQAPASIERGGRKAHGIQS